MMHNPVILKVPCEECSGQGGNMAYKPERAVEI